MQTINLKGNTNLVGTPLMQEEVEAVEGGIVPLVIGGLVVLDTYIGYKVGQGRGWW